MVRIGGNTLYNREIWKSNTTETGVRYFHHDGFILMTPAKSTQPKSKHTIQRMSFIAMTPSRQSQVIIQLPRPQPQRSSEKFIQRRMSQNKVISKDFILENTTPEKAFLKEVVVEKFNLGKGDRGGVGRDSQWFTEDSRFVRR